ncbi:MAG TPA: hypothetical protein VI356_17010 [Myxococcales bacterium]
MLELRSTVEKAHLIDPEGNAVEQEIEHRIDPLTSSVASINARLGEKAKAFFLGGGDEKLLADYQEKTRASCPFCSVAGKGTRFPEGFAEGGQLRIGRCVAVPNLFAKAGFDCVAIIDPARHVLFPSQLAREALADGLRVARELVARARQSDPALKHHVAGMNFLPAGGSSMPHPHYQVHVRRVPYSRMAALLHLGAAFYEKNRRSYWDVLVEEEQKLGARYIGRQGRVEWLAAYAPAHQREIWGVIPGISTISELTDADADGLAAGISRVIALYESLGSHPFTFALLSSPEAAPHFALHVKVCSRPPFKPMYSNYDTWFTPKFMGDDVHTQTPEELAGLVRQRW